MKKRHPEDYERYGQHIRNILSNPDFVGINPSDSSIEYVKQFRLDNKYVKVAVRISTGNKYFARTLYTLNNSRVDNFIKKGYLKKI